MAAGATGEAETGPLRLQFDRSVKLAFRRSSISSDGGLLLHREMDDAISDRGSFPVAFGESDKVRKRYL